ncbi:MAG: glycoside hydrolase family 2 TIM barrel-domain containing protein, partial [Bacteroidota bacterium]
KLSPQSRNTPADPHDFTDMISRMYPTPREFMEMDASQIGAKPVISCEYTHAMGNSNGGLKMIWDIIHASKRIAGGFIWDWMDQGILAEEDGCEQYVYGGYFGELINDGNFCLNGIINSDQTVKPVMYECKYVFQPFTFTKFDPRRGNFLITNRTAFTHSEAYDFTYEVLADGKSVATGNFADLKLAGGASAPVKIPAVESTTGREYFLNVYAKQKEATTWSEPGYVVASEQFALVPPPAPAAAPDFMTDTPPLKAANEGGRYVVSGPGFTVAFDRETGYLTELKKRGAYVITGPVRPNFWRAVTDNDRAVIRNKPGIKIWKEATTDQQLRDFTTEETDRGTFLVKTTYRLANTDLTYHLRYTIRPDGTIAVDNDFIAPNGLDNLPRVGLSLGLAENLTQIEWYGKGPHENYVDRNASAFVGRYQTDLAGLGTEFVYPQANANRTEVRWASFTDGTGTGLQVSGNFEFSAYEQTLDNLDAATYRCELTKADAITLNLDHKQQGVGGYNSWSLKAAPLLEHSVLSQRYTFSFTLR